MSQPCFAVFRHGHARDTAARGCRARRWVERLRPGWQTRPRATELANTHAHARHTGERSISPNQGGRKAGAEPWSQAPFRVKITYRANPPDPLAAEVAAGDLQAQAAGRVHVGAGVAGHHTRRRGRGEAQGEADQQRAQLGAEDEGLARVQTDADAEEADGERGDGLCEEHLARCDGGGIVEAAAAHVAVESRKPSPSVQPQHGRRESEESTRTSPPKKKWGLSTEGDSRRSRLPAPWTAKHPASQGTAESLQEDVGHAAGHGAEATPHGGPGDEGVHVAARRRRGGVDEDGQQHRVEDADVRGQLARVEARERHPELPRRVDQEHGGEAFDSLCARGC